MLATIVERWPGSRSRSGWLVFPETTWFGLPTAETLTAALDAAGRVGEQARVQVAPSPPLAPLMLAGSPASGPRCSRRTRWRSERGAPCSPCCRPSRSWASRTRCSRTSCARSSGCCSWSRRRRCCSPTGSGACRAGARCGRHRAGPRGSTSRPAEAPGAWPRRPSWSPRWLPIVLPGFGSRGVIDFSTTSDDRVRIDPLVSVQASLHARRGRPGVRGRSRRRAVLAHGRAAELRRTTSGARIPSPATVADRARRAARDVDACRETRRDDRGDVHDHERARVAVAAAPLPTRCRPTRRSMACGGTRGGLDLISRAASSAGVTYTRRGRQVVQPTPERASRRSTIAATRPRPYAVTPADLPPEIGDVGRTVDRERGHRLRRGSSRSRTRFTDPTGSSPTTTTCRARRATDAMVEFLTQTKDGLLPAVLERDGGDAANARHPGAAGRRLHARAVHRRSGDRLTVTTENAHSWVEVLFPSFGWVPVRADPEPAERRRLPLPRPRRSASRAWHRAGAGDGGQPAARGPPRQSAASSAALRGAPTACSAPRSRAAAIGGRARPPASANAAPVRVRVTARRCSPRRRVARRVGLALVPAARGPGAAGCRLRRAGPAPRTLILATYDVFAERAAELGHPRESRPDPRGVPARRPWPRAHRARRRPGSADPRSRPTRPTPGVSPARHEAAEATRASHAVVPRDAAATPAGPSAHRAVPATLTLAGR